MTPTAIELHKKSGILELAYDDGGRFQLSAEFLRVHSPSAEVRGHGKGQEVLQIGKREVAITAIRPVGNYAIRLDFSDGHNTGIFSWPYLRELCLDQDRLWQAYLAALEQAGASRDALPADTQVIKIQP
ncbi:MAG: DUF971 domain-containing protein [Pseudohongiellaceae bacterium]